MEGVRLVDRIGATERLGSIPCTPESHERSCDHTRQQLLNDLAKAKVVFQTRAIMAAMGIL